MAKQKKYPKKPKATASLKTWENHREKCKAVDKYNAGIQSDKKKKESVINQVDKIRSKRK